MASILSDRELWTIKHRFVQGEDPKDIAKYIGCSVKKVMLVSSEVREKFHTVPDDVALKIIDDYEDNGLSIKELAQKYCTRRKTVEWVLFDEDGRMEDRKSRHKNFDEWFKNEWKEVTGHE